MSFLQSVGLELIKFASAGSFFVFGQTVMRTTPLYVALLASTGASFGATTPVDPPGEKNQAVAEDGERGESPIYLTANSMSIATGKPSLVTMSRGPTHIPVWSLSGGTAGQSVAGLVSGLPSGCGAVKVEIVVTGWPGHSLQDYHLAVGLGGDGICSDIPVAIQTWKAKHK